MYLQALPYFDCSKGDCEVTKWTPSKRRCCRDLQQNRYDKSTYRIWWHVVKEDN
jgi:hypothetical protein